MLIRQFRSREFVLALLCLAGIAAIARNTEAQTVVNKVKERGYVSCGASQGRSEERRVGKECA